MDYAFVNKTNYKPVELHPLILKKDIVAFGAAGRSIMGVALTRDGEVWTWGKVLGEYTSGSPVLQSLAEVTKWKTDRFQSKRITRDKPWMLPIQE